MPWIYISIWSKFDFNIFSKMSTGINKQTGTPKECDKSKTCPNCSTSYTTTYSLFRHMRKAHQVYPSRGVTLYCPYDLCSASFDRYSGIDLHLAQVHYTEVRKENLCFSDLPAFEAWLLQITSSSKTKYIKRSCNQSYRYYRCHRSGLPKTSTDKIDSMKSSVKIGRHCPSRIIAKITDRNVQVEFVPTHIGHECDIAKIPLSQKKRLDIACRLATATNNSVAASVAAVAVPNEAQQQQSIDPTLTPNHQLNHEQHLQPQPPSSQQDDNSLIVTLAPMKTTTVQQNQQQQLGHPMQQTHLIQNQLGQLQQQQAQVQNNTSIGPMAITSPNRQELTARFEQLMMSIRSDKHASIVKAQLEVCFALIRD